MAHQTRIKREALPGSEAVRVRIWECKVCGDRWSIRGSEEEKAVAWLIQYHLSTFHGNRIQPGHYYVWSVIRPPRYDWLEVAR